jgi:hypothetical protein
MVACPPSDRGGPTPTVRACASSSRGPAFFWRHRASCMSHSRPNSPEFSRTDCACIVSIARARFPVERKNALRNRPFFSSDGSRYKRRPGGRQGCATLLAGIITLPQEEECEATSYQDDREADVQDDWHLTYSCLVANQPRQGSCVPWSSRDTLNKSNVRATNSIAITTRSEVSRSARTECAR